MTTAGRPRGLRLVRLLPNTPGSLPERHPTSRREKVMDKTMQGKRVELIPQQGGFQLLKAGEYGKWTDGTWHGCTPGDNGCNLSAHKITEHEDGTITVSPSIRVSITNSKGADQELWHGWLERGIWRSC
jgi:hypothetical protein